MLKNAYLLAKVSADTAENERNFAQNLPNTGNYPTAPRLARSPEERPWIVAPLAARLSPGRSPARTSGTAGT